MDLVLHSVEGSFPAGTTVTARLVSDFPVGWRAADGVPAGAASQGTAVVQADGSLTITGLTAGTRYRLSATVGGVAVFVTHFLAPPMGESPDYAAFSDGQAAIWNAAAGRFEGFDPAKQTELDAHTALTATAHGGLQMSEPYTRPYELFVNPSNGNDSNLGNSPGQAFATLKKAVDTINTAQHAGHIRILNYSSTITLSQPLVFLYGTEISVEVPQACAINRGFATPAGRSFWDAITTAAGTSVQSATAAFVSGDVGKIAMIYGAGTGGGTYYGFITAVPDGTHATIPATAIARNSTTDPRGVKASVVGDWDRVVTDAAMTSGSRVLTSATAAFTSADLGTEIVVAGAGQNGQALRAAIKVVTNATTVTLTAVASATVSSKRCAIRVIFGDMLVYHVGSCGLRGMTLQDVSNTSDRIGSALKVVVPDGGAGAQVSLGDLVFEDLTFTSTGASGAWEHMIDIDGSWNQASGGPGVRRAAWRNLKIFGSRRALETMRINGAVHHNFLGTGIVGSAPTAVSQGIVILDPQKTAAVQYSVSDVHFTNFDGVATSYYCEGQNCSYMGGRLQRSYTDRPTIPTVELAPTSLSCIVSTANASVVASVGAAASDEWDSGTLNLIHTAPNARRITNKAYDTAASGPTVTGIADHPGIETISRRGFANASQAVGSSGVLVLMSIWLPGGFSLSKVAFGGGGTALAWGSGWSNPHFMYGLYDPLGNLYAQTDDTGGTQVFSNSTLATNLLSLTKDASGTALSSVRVPLSGLNWIGLLINSGTGGSAFTFPTFGGGTNSWAAITPALCGTSGSGRTSLPTSFTPPPTGSSSLIYGVVA